MTDNIENDSPEYKCKISMNRFYDQPFCLATRRNPGGANERRSSENARKERPCCQPCKLKDFFFEEDLGTGFFYDKFSFFPGLLSQQ